MKHYHYSCYKPPGYLSQFIYEGKRKGSKKLLGALYDFVPKTMAIGRLDEASEGLLLLTTDGKISEAIRSSKYQKEYYVQLDGKITHQAIEQLKKGVIIGFFGKKYKTKTCEVKQLSTLTPYPIEDRKVRSDSKRGTSWISITITEGKFRQVRKMTAAVGFPTLRLIRVRIGAIELTQNSGEVKTHKNLF